MLLTQRYKGNSISGKTGTRDEVEGAGCITESKTED